ncbi:hypothetical protein Patl1_00632 [Pistacia atlantica]|uniref:Uncharacterized protein n=1 Tax=Pistacia atlantica TaxID=434234 RepID=A0ACC1C991_9ROSI|nr:hypothetical protein Patl1_00632 [Pistacia atlantica]
MFAFREKIPIEAEGFFKQQGAGSTIQSNDIERFSHLFSRNKWAISLQNCAQFHMWQFRQDLFVSWGKTAEGNRVGGIFSWYRPPLRPPCSNIACVDLSLTTQQFASNSTITLLSLVNLEMLSKFFVMFGTQSIFPRCKHLECSELGKIEWPV